MERPPPHAVLVPLPTPGHMDPMLKLAKLLHSRHGFHITYVLTHHIHHCLTHSASSQFPPQEFDGFRIEVISDGLPLSGRDGGAQYMKALKVALRTTFMCRLRERLKELGDDPNVPAVSCVVAGLLGPAVEVAEEMGVPGVLFWTTSACGFLSTIYMDELVGRGYIPLKDESFYTSGYLDTIVDWIPGLRPIRLRDTTSFVNTTDPHDEHIRFHVEAAKWASRASAVVLNTFEDLERDALQAMEPKFKRLLTIGPLSSLPNSSTEEVSATPSNLDSLKLNLWKEDRDCLSWLDKQEPNSVLYISFGSISIMKPGQLEEFAWGIAVSKVRFLWIVRPDIVVGEAAKLPDGFEEEMKGRGLVCGWCPQEEVLAHPSVGGFLTHGGWNSMLEAICHGVPMLCWLSVFADQPTNCRYACEEWGVAMEVGEGEVDRRRVEGRVKELMGGGVGKKLKERCMQWRKKADRAAAFAERNIDELAAVLTNDATKHSY